ncbi:hypothetical protein QYE76_015685 [Lolium multiflorum]|uniref:Reverse transcriptase zinc-binding domain-containing protein n=1 Tax=Lolium multiflorum TaxID=4521 RepID=A0AAD8X6M1_LOLMU|nr:hypothetical protein QYE76_015685 [Lolium multiflorum]
MENYSLLMGDSSGDEDGGGVDGEVFRGHFPIPAVCRNRLLSPHLGFAMAAALEGIPNLRLLNVALRCRWAWLQRTDSTKALVDSVMAVSLGKGESVLFWKDRWIDGAWVADLAPNLATLEDAFRWRWTADGVYSAKSAYGAFFAGTTVAPVASQIWRSRGPYSCKFFAWLASRNRCWTVDRLQRRGLPHPVACPLCDQESESIQHLLLGCVVAREVWAWALARWGKMEWLPSVDTELLQWWSLLTCPPGSRRNL